MKKLQTLAVAALLGGAVLTPAHAITTIDPVGLTTTYFENFNGGTDFATAAWFNAQGADDYLWLSALAPVATFSFTSDYAIASLDLSFWYSAPGAANGNFTLATLTNVALSGTNPLTFLLNNPGFGGLASSDRQFQTTLNNLDAGDYTLSFNRIGGLGNSMKVDDVTIAVTAVPEPETYALMLAGLGVVSFVARRRRPNRD